MSRTARVRKQMSRKKWRGIDRDDIIHANKISLCSIENVEWEKAPGVYDVFIVQTIHKWRGVWVPRDNKPRQSVWSSRGPGRLIARQGWQPGAYIGSIRIA